MSKIKSLILGSAAGLVAIGGAQAADLPVKAKAVEYVKVCSLYGAGFYYIPGTDTCIRLGGYLRAEVTFNGTATDTAYLNGAPGVSSRNANDYTARSRIMVALDTRTATEYGVVRTFAQFGPQFTTGDSLGTGNLKVETAFIQFAGFTFGRSYSAYTTPWNGYPGNIGSGLWGGPTFDSGVNNVQYTFQFGNGFSANIGVDEQSTSNRAGLLNGSYVTAGSLVGSTSTSTANIFTITAAGLQAFAGYQGNSGADIVGNLKLDQAWGLLQVSAAAHDVSSTYYNNVYGAYPSDKWGFAVTGALSLKNLPFGPGDSINIEGTYTEGALKYLIGNSGAVPTNIAYTDGNKLAVAPIADGVIASGGAGAIQLTKGYGMRGAYNHNWNANWTTSLFGSWVKVDYNGTATTSICTSAGGNWQGALGISAAQCNPDFTLSQVGLLQTWTPVKGLAFYAEGMWTHVDPGSSGTTGTITIDPSRPSTTWNLKGADQFSGALRVQRNF